MSYQSVSVMAAGSVRNPGNESGCSHTIISGSQIYTTIYSTQNPTQYLLSSGKPVSWALCSPVFFISTDGRGFTISGGYCTSQMQGKKNDETQATPSDGATFQHCSRKRPAGNHLFSELMTRLPPKKRWREDSGRT